MWIFLSDSFLSVVDKGDPSGQTLLVRARRRGDIERVFPSADIIENAGTDYRYRARIDREQVALAMAEQVRAIRYPNYKGAVHDEALHDACVNVWSAMARLQDGKARR